MRPVIFSSLLERRAWRVNELSVHRRLSTSLVAAPWTICSPASRLDAMKALGRLKERREWRMKEHNALRKQSTSVSTLVDTEQDVGRMRERRECRMKEQKARKRLSTSLTGSSGVDENCGSNPGGYRRRFRGRKGSDVRVGPPRDLGAVEQALRNAATRKTKHILELVVSTSFDSLAEAYEFYDLYSWEVGFRVRYGSSYTNAVAPSTVAGSLATTLQHALQKTMLWHLLLLQR